MLKHFVVLLFVPFCVVSCEDRERERIMAEIERLELLRSKAGEFLVEQEMNLLEKKLEYELWKMELTFKIELSRNRAAKKELSEKEPSFLKQIEKMEKDLKVTQATYDSRNTLHTIEVGKLAKFGSE